MKIRGSIKFALWPLLVFVAYFCFLTPNTITVGALSAVAFLLYLLEFSTIKIGEHNFYTRRRQVDFDQITSIKKTPSPKHRYPWVTKLLQGSNQFVIRTDLDDFVFWDILYTDADKSIEEISFKSGVPILYDFGNQPFDYSFFSAITQSSYPWESNGYQRTGEYDKRIVAQINDSEQTPVTTLICRAERCTKGEQQQMFYCRFQLEVDGTTTDLPTQYISNETTVSNTRTSHDHIVCHPCYEVMLAGFFESLADSPPQQIVINEGEMASLKQNSDISADIYNSHYSVDREFTLKVALSKRAMILSRKVYQDFSD